MPPTSQTTSTSRPKLSSLAKHLAVPAGIVSSEWPSVRRTCVNKLGITFDDWQDETGRLILTKRADGTLAATIDGVGLSLPRQVGKTYLIGALVFALCVNKPGLLVIWSAHHARTHGETFLAMQGFADRAKVKPHIKQVFTGSGDEEIRFHNGSRILFGARERGFGRGIPGVDILIFDEAQILSERALANMLATMNTSRFGLQLYIGTPPKPEDNSEAFARMRREAIAGTLLDGAWVEFGADNGADHDDRKQWRKANPSFPKRTPAQSMLRLKRKLTVDDWLREGMGIWDDEGRSLPIPLAAWSARGDTSSHPAPHVGRLVLAVDTDPDRKRTTIVAAGARASGPPMIEVTTGPDGLPDNRDGVDWAAQRVVDIVKRAKTTDSPVGAVVIDAGSAAMSLAQPLIEARVPVVITKAGDYAAACGQFHDAAVETGDLTHLDDPLFVVALKAATKRKLRDAWVWDKKSPTADITPLVAATLALWGHTAGVGVKKNAGTGRVIALT